MSQYLSRFYCGNKDGLCNFMEPMEYEKLIDRQFDNLLTEVIDECKGDGKEKGYCCQNTPENQQPMEVKDLEKINKIAKGKIFKKDDKGNFYPNQIPLIKTNLEDGKVKSIDLCQCGGMPNDYNNCIDKNCKNYRVPTKYEYCKLGDMSSQFGCYGDSQEECEVGRLDPDSGMVHSPKMRINNLLPDCYLNICNKRMINGSLENTANWNPESQYFAYRDTNVLNKDSISDYLLLNKKQNVEEPNTIGEFSIGSILKQ